MSTVGTTSADPLVADARSTAIAPLTARLPRWWPLAALTVLAAILRLATLDVQSFWYDEAFTPVHVLHPSLWATLRSVVHTENTPPLWYLLAWADERVLGSSEIALRLPSALAGIATVPVAWAIGNELSGRRAAVQPRARTGEAQDAATAAAVVTAALVAVGPLFVWYSQEARAYALFVLMAALALLCFLRAEREPSTRNMAAFAIAGALALLTHYFAVFLLCGMGLWLLLGPGERRPLVRRAALPALAALMLVAAALLPLIIAQGGHGTQWIGRWPLSERLEAIPQYYLTGASGAPLGHGIELLVALLIIAALCTWMWRTGMRPLSAPPGPEIRGALIATTVAGCGVLIPIVLVAFGADYLAPRNLVAAMVPVSALIALAFTAPVVGRMGLLLAALAASALLAITIDVDLSPRLQRGNWRQLARVITATPTGVRERAITTVELGAAPFEYYIPGLRNLHRGQSVTVAEIDETGYAPLRRSAEEPPAPGFRLAERRDVDGLILYRFVSPVARTVSEAALRRHVITSAQSEVLVGGAGSAPGARLTTAMVRRGSTLRANAVRRGKGLALPRWRR